MAIEPTTPPDMTDLTAPPLRDGSLTPQEFSNETGEWLSAQQVYSTELNATTAWQKATAQEVYDNAGEAANSAETAGSAANFQGEWSTLTGAYSAGISVSEDDTIYGLLADTADITAIQPSLNPDDWIITSDSKKALKLTYNDNASPWETINNTSNFENIRKSMRYSLASLPNLYKRIVNYNDSTSPDIKIVGMGSSVGNGAALPSPSTQAPVIKFGEYFNAKFNKLGNMTVTTVNESVDGSTLNGGLGILDTVISTHSPDVIVLAFGMNDGTTTQFNGNQTYPFVYTNIKLIQDKCRAAGCDLIVMTTPHPQTDTVGWSMSGGIDQVYPTFVASPVADESLIPPVSTSIRSIDYLGIGENIDVSYRHYRVNEGQRRACADLGVTCIDVERYWFEAVHSQGIDNLYDGAETVHPNLLGHQLSYWHAMNDFIASVSESYAHGNQQNNFLVGNVGINTLSPDATLELVQNKSTESVAIIKNSLGAIIAEMDLNGDLTATANPWTLNRALTIKEPVQGTELQNYVAAVLNNGSVINSSTPTDQSGEILIRASKSGIGEQLTKYAWINESDVVTMTEIYNMGDAVLTSVVGNSSGEIVITPVGANTNVSLHRTTLTFT